MKTSKVKSVKEIEYKGYVYDIGVGGNFPFTLYKKEASKELLKKFLSTDYIEVEDDDIIFQLKPYEKVLVKHNNDIEVRFAIELDSDCEILDWEYRDV